MTDDTAVCRPLEQLSLNMPQETQSRLLALPPELRDLIYNFYFVGSVFNLLHSEQFQLSLCSLLPRKFRLLSVCRSIRHEALHVFFRDTVFVIRKPLDLTSLRSQMMAKDLFPGVFYSTITCLRLQESFDTYSWWGRRQPGPISRSWEDLDNVLARCSNLREIQIVAREPYGSDLVDSEPTTSRSIETLLNLYSLRQKQHLMIRIFIQPREAPRRQLPLDKFKTLHKFLEAQARGRFNIKILPYRHIGYPDRWDIPMH